ncbi:transporter substrate-binding domain-containing protein [Nesterenkonia muleiensis]|uniref:transporter substrate-binding domain-containing protein n=1 Tax=Nesterenkonia muleiensis TaxID=2282648 RepID=UPI000E73565C|nr:transporter substrate-binding domain-containing protein [Nesterenkonia muleiensis]
MPPEFSSVAADLAPSATLRAAINLGNPVLVPPSPGEPTGVTVDIAAEVARRLEVAVELLPFSGAKKSFEAVVEGRADLCFLAVEPARAAEVSFTAPYVVIEGVYAVAENSPITAAEDVDRPGVRIAVKEGSAYDLYLTRSLGSAGLIRSDEGIGDYQQGKADVVAGIRQPITAFVGEHPGHRVLEPAFTQIKQALGVSKDRAPETVAFLDALIEELKATGFIAESLRRSGREASLVAPPGSAR